MLQYDAVEQAYLADKSLLGGGQRRPWSRRCALGDARLVLAGGDDVVGGLDEAGAKLHAGVRHFRDGKRRKSCEPMLLVISKMWASLEEEERFECLDGKSRNHPRTGLCCCYCGCFDTLLSHCQHARLPHLDAAT